MDRKKKLDTLHSIKIRLRDTNDEGYGRCISCGAIVHYSKSDCGHYVNRSVMSLRYDDKNTNIQCRSCNRFKEGNALGYTRGLIEKYGKNVLKELEIKKANISKLTANDYDILIKEFRKEARELASQKMFKVNIP